MRTRITVRWWDGYLEIFENVTEWRAGSHLLWIKMNDGHTRHIPLQQVRWFEPEVIIDNVQNNARDMLMRQCERR